MKIDFSQGAYLARSLSASAEQQLNLYAEVNPKDASHPVTLYPTPGLKLVADYTGTISGRCRCLYWSSGLTLFAVFGTTFVRIDPGWTYHFIGNIGADTGYPVSMVDNGTYIFIVDGSLGGWTYGLLTGAFAACTDAQFFGSTRIDYIDTFFVLTRSNTQQWYISNSLDITFTLPTGGGNAVNKAGYNDLVVSIAALHDVIWVFGQVTTELFFNAGTADPSAPGMPWQRMPQGILQQGCFSSYSVVVADNAVYWLSQDRHGHLMMMRGEGYSAKRVSNFAVEQAWSDYDLGAGIIYSMVYQAEGHEFIVIQFQGIATWVYDATTGFWHSRQTAGGPWLPGAISYWKAGAYTFAGHATTDFVVAGDSSVAKLYEIDRFTYTDNGVPIQRARSFQHVLNDQKRLTHNQFVAAMPGGVHIAPDQISLVWSDDGGQTFGTPVVQTTNGASNGQYSWRRLGMARDRVYQLEWTASGETALNGAWLEATPADT